MRLRDVSILFVCIILAAGLLIAAGTRLDFINAQRKEMNLITNEPLENAPPSLAFATIAMGAFRGLVVDVLWLRADRLKRKGQFFDAKQLAEWITTLQPRFPAVWEFHAWNMAYNISVSLPATEPQERWRWVKNGYELLRDKGIPLNPKSITLYRELASIFQHKIGFITDDAHKYYKLQLASAMEPLLGPADAQYFKALVEAPLDWSEIIKDNQIAQFVEDMKSADDRFANDDTFVSNYLSLRQNPRRFNPQAFNVIDYYRGKAVLEKFDIFAKAYNLRNTWKLDPVLMQRLNETYGPIAWDDPNTHLPFDWRHPDVHAIYWAVKGLEVAGKGQFSAAEVNTDRIVGHSLQDLFFNGKIFIYNVPVKTGENSLPETSNLTGKEIFLRPDLRMFESLNTARLATIAKYKDLSKSSYVSMQNGHRNLLKNAVLLFYQAGLHRQGQRIYDQLRQLYPADKFKVPLPTFVKNLIQEKLPDIHVNDTKRIIMTLLMEAYFRYAVRDDDESYGREKMAEELYDYYRALYSSEQRIKLPDFKLLRYLALIDFFDDPQYPIHLRLSLINRIKIERPELAEQFKQREAKILEEMSR